MPALLFIIIIFPIFVSFILWLTYLDTYSKITAFFALLIDLLSTLAFIWLIYACCQPLEIEKEEITKIKLVTFPNGTNSQMFHFDNTNYNANEMFKSVLPENTSVICTKYKSTYVGIIFIVKPIFVLKI